MVHRLLCWRCWLIGHRFAVAVLVAAFGGARVLEAQPGGVRGGTVGGVGPCGGTVVARFRAA
jgi:hypothetical protein